ncbi:MAG: hypothetical protein ACO1OD_01870 [Croceibacterium sp.]
MGIDGKRVALATAAGMIGLAATPALAQDTSPEGCVRAYAGAAAFQAESMGLEAKGEGLHSLGGLTENWLPTSVWEGRARDVARKAADPDRFTFGGTPEHRLGEQDAIAAIVDGKLADNTALWNPDEVFENQRKLFAAVRACDLAHGFDPPLGVPPAQDVVIGLFNDRLRRRDEQAAIRERALAGLDDRQCAARFYVLGALMAQDAAFQQVMRTKMQAAAGKAREADPALEPQRFLEMVQREAQERGSKMTKAEDVDPLLEEVNACETRYGQPLTKRN